jgi:hypothetical protein
MARSFNGTSELMQATYSFSGVGIIPPTSVVGIGAWLYRDDNAANAMILEFGNTVGTAGFDVIQNVFAGPADEVRSFWGANSWADSYPSPATGGWHHHLWVMGMGGHAGGNFVWIDGTAQTLTNQGHGAGAPADYGGFSDQLSFAARLTSGVASRWAKIRLAEIGLWTMTTEQLNGQHATTLWQGRPPYLAFDDGLPSYYPLQGDSTEPNIGSGPENLTVTGSTVINHPPVDSILGGLYGSRL